MSSSMAMGTAGDTELCWPQAAQWGFPILD